MHSRFEHFEFVSDVSFLSDCPRCFSGKTLDNNYVERSLLNIGRRLKRGEEFFNPASLQELGPKLSPVEQIFDEFFASLKDFVDNWHIEHPE